MFIKELEIEIACIKRQYIFKRIYKEVRIINERQKERERGREILREGERGRTGKKWKK